jgi:hypothetical protein
MRLILLKNGWWLIGAEVRRVVAKHLEGPGVIGHIVQGSDAKWKIEGRNHEFDSAALAADTLVDDLTKHPVDSLQSFDLWPIRGESALRPLLTDSDNGLKMSTS